MKTSFIDSASRRDFLRTVGCAGITWGALSFERAGLGAEEPAAQPAGKKLIVRQAKPFNAEAPLDRLASDWITPLEAFFVRNHAPIPEINLNDFQVSIEGLVDRPLKLSVAELSEKFPAVKTTATLTCAGNRRSEFTGEKISGVAWGAGAAGNAEWGGVSLAALLKQVGLQAGAKHVWFEGADTIVDKSESYPFGGSVPLEKVLTSDVRRTPTLLATTMNGKPLAPEHGAPLRMVVPGFIGARSVKWLRKIVVSDRPSPNHYVAHAYKILPEETPAAIDAASPIYEMALNSVICVPSVEQAVPGETVQVKGFALPSGHNERTIRSVELSIDGGKTWTTAKLTSPVREFCWVQWAADMKISNQTERIIVCATDSSGAVQPQQMTWNAKGYQYNAWHQLKLKRG